MEGRGGVGVKNIQRKMNYPLPSGGGKKKPIGANSSKKKSSKSPEERQENEVLQRKGALKSIYQGV